MKLPFRDYEPAITAKEQKLIAQHLPPNMDAEEHLDAYRELEAALQERELDPTFAVFKEGTGGTNIEFITPAPIARLKEFFEAIDKYDFAPLIGLGRGADIYRCIPRPHTPQEYATIEDLAPEYVKVPFSERQALDEFILREETPPLHSYTGVFGAYPEDVFLRSYWTRRRDGFVLEPRRAEHKTYK